MQMPAAADVKTVVDNLVALIKNLVEIFKSFIDGFQKKITVGEGE